MKENKLIAMFMGDIRLVDDNVSFTKNCPVNELQYHISWDWLMPVVQKIGEDFNVAIYDNDGIEKVYKRVVEFINEYNKNK